MERELAAQKSSGSLRAISGRDREVCLFLRELSDFLLFFSLRASVVSKVTRNPYEFKQTDTRGRRFLQVCIQGHRQVDVRVRICV